MLFPPALQCLYHGQLLEAVPNFWCLCQGTDPATVTLGSSSPPHVTVLQTTYYAGPLHLQHLQVRHSLSPLVPGTKTDAPARPGTLLPVSQTAVMGSGGHLESF